MSTTSSLRIEIDDEILRRPELLEAVHQATTYLEGRVRDAEIQGLNDLSIDWSYRPEDSGWVVATLRLWDKSGGERGFRLIPVRDMHDPVSRETWTLRVWRDLLSKLSRRSHVRTGQALRELQEQENGTADLH